jgi:glycerophosphoryl diester phosphodiesterase
LLSGKPVVLRPMIFLTIAKRVIPYAISGVFYTGILLLPGLLSCRSYGQEVGKMQLAGESKTAGARPSDLRAILYDFYHRPDRVLISAHRADHSMFPENSLPSVSQAIRAGIDIVELDVRETKDSVLVLMHDKNIDRTTTGKGLVQDYTYRELQQFRLLQDGKPTGERIPTFEEVLVLAKGHIMIDIDFKADTGRAARETYRQIIAHHMEKQVLFFVYDYKDIADLRGIDAKVPIMPRAYNSKDMQAILAIGGFPVMHVDDSWYSDSVMGHIRQSGVRVWINALGKFDDLEEKQPGAGFDGIFQMRQVNVIQTNLPEQLLSYLRTKGLHR